MFISLFASPFYQTFAQIKGQILASKGGHSFTSEHVQIYTGYTELLTMTLLTNSEKQAIQKNLIDLFNQYPAQIVSFAVGLQSDFNTFKQLSDPKQVGLAWGIIKGYFYQNTYSYPDEQLALFAKLAKNRAPVLAYNHANKAAITETDIEGFVYFVNLNNTNAGFDQPARKSALRNDIIAQFPNLEINALAEVMYYAYLGTMIHNVTKQLNPYQQKQFLAQFNTSNSSQHTNNSSLSESEYNGLMEQIIREGNLGRHNTIQDMSVGGYKEYWYSKSGPSSILGW